MHGDRNKIDTLLTKWAKLKKKEVRLTTGWIAHEIFVPASVKDTKK